MNQRDSRLEPMDERFLPVSVDRLLELESRLGVPLPRGYVAFLSHYGACGFSGDANVKYARGTLPIFTFFGDQELMAKMEFYEDLTAENKLLIADDMAGNPYVLDALNGTVYYLDFSVNPPVATMIAGSFEEFLAAIQVEPFQ